MSQVLACIVQYYENMEGLQICPLFFCLMENICVKVKDSDIRIVYDKGHLVSLWQSEA
jgi:hypothetical protein